MFPFNLFKKKKEEIPEEESQLPMQQDFSMQNTQREFTGIDKEDLILSRLETINAKLSNIEERLKRIEEIANS